MQYVLCSIIFVLFSLGSRAQDPVAAPAREYRGTQPPDSAVIQLLEEDARLFATYRDIAMRDSLRRRLLSPGYFYHGLDGKPIDLEGLTQRQERNGFKLLASSVLREILYQYESTAILVLHEELTTLDKGMTKTSLRSCMLVMGKENGRWVFQADIMGKDPPR
ncbi:MAG TPA: hypothetical protein VGE21_05645 [Flavobacteriales bacterium]